jgi:hypothetical protein
MPSSGSFTNLNAMDPYPMNPQNSLSNVMNPQLTATSSYQT